MRAAISGRAAFAVLNDGDNWQAISYEDPDNVWDCTSGDAAQLLGTTPDVFWVDDVSLEQVRDSLSDEVDVTETIDGVLFLLDGTLRRETRDVVAMELDELLRWPDLVELAEHSLLARPFPASADFDGAIAACRRTQCSATLAILQHWRRLQPSVVNLFVAWLENAAKGIESSEERDQIEGLMIRHGVFSQFVKASTNRKALIELQWKLSRNAELNQHVRGIASLVAGLSAAAHDFCSKTSAELHQELNREQMRQILLHARRHGLIQSFGKSAHGQLRKRLKRISGRILNKHVRTHGMR